MQQTAGIAAVRVTPSMPCTGCPPILRLQIARLPRVRSRASERGRVQVRSGITVDRLEAVDGELVSGRPDMLRTVRWRSRPFEGRKHRPRTRLKPVRTGFRRITPVGEPAGGKNQTTSPDNRAETAPCRNRVEGCGPTRGRRHRGRPRRDAPRAVPPAPGHRLRVFCTVFNHELLASRRRTSRRSRSRLYSTRDLARIAREQEIDVLFPELPDRRGGRLSGGSVRSSSSPTSSTSPSRSSSTRTRCVRGRGIPNRDARRRRDHDDFRIRKADDSPATGTTASLHRKAGPSTGVPHFAVRRGDRGERAHSPAHSSSFPPICGRTRTTNVSSRRSADSSNAQRGTSNWCYGSPTGWDELRPATPISRSGTSVTSSPHSGFSTNAHSRYVLLGVRGLRNPSP